MEIALIVNLVYKDFGSNSSSFIIKKYDEYTANGDTGAILELQP